MKELEAVGELVLRLHPDGKMDMHVTALSGPQCFYLLEFARKNLVEASFKGSKPSQIVAPAGILR